jgi:hypothetical protein
VSQETLKWLRLIIPGILLVFVLPPLFQETLDLASYLERFSSIKVLSDSVAAVVLGALYQVLDLRRFAWRRFLRQVNDNIKDKLLTACSDDDVISPAARQLREGRALMHVFYRLIDKDPTLQEKAKRVRFNGLFWTSIADIATIGAFGAFAYWIAFRVTDRFHQLVVAGALGLVFLVAYFLLMPLVTRRHMDLSNEQLEIITQHFRSDLCADIRTIADGG